MQAYMTAVVAFFRAAQVPVYWSGLAPEGTSFPYMTLSVSLTPFAGAAQLTATVWYREAEGHAKRLAMADRLKGMVPEEGVQLSFLDGLAMLHRASGSFVTLLADPEDRGTLGVRLRFTVRLYDL